MMDQGKDPKAVAEELESALRDLYPNSIPCWERLGDAIKNAIDCLNRIAKETKRV